MANVDRWKKRVLKMLTKQQEQLDDVYADGLLLAGNQERDRIACNLSMLHAAILKLMKDIAEN